MLVLGSVTNLPTKVLDFKKSGLKSSLIRLIRFSLSSCQLFLSQDYLLLPSFKSQQKKRLNVDIRTEKSPCVVVRLKIVEVVQRRFYLETLKQYMISITTSFKRLMP